MGLRSPLTESMDTVVYVDEQRKLLLDCAYAHAQLDDHFSLYGIRPFFPHSDVYNKKKIQMFVVNMTFISSREVKKCICHSCLRLT